jgi:DNA-nicking Smr family endonuclease
VTKRDDDAHAFEEAMRGARPLARAARVPVGPTNARAPARRAPPPAAVDPEAPLDAAGGFLVETRGETIAGRSNGVDARRLRALTEEAPLEARLDLHGQPRERALAALERFVARARADGRRAVLVIHGRGAHSDDARPVLKPLVWRWLAASPAAATHVLAFASARPARGGDGATVLALRRPPRER